MAHTRLGNLRFITVLASFYLVFSATAAPAQTTIGVSGEAPPEPANVSATDKHHHMTIEWTNPKDSPASEYRLYRLENYDPQKTLKLIAVVPRADATAAAAAIPPSHDKTITKMLYEDSTAQMGHTYTYFVTARDPFGNESHNSKMSTAQLSVYVTRPAPSR